jgi:hypothetical protein
MVPMASSVERVHALLHELGVEDRVARVAENVWTLQKGSATVQIVVAPEFVVATAKLAESVPAERREETFRVLLEANVKLLGAFFTLEQNGSIRINQVLPVDWLQDKELAFIIGNVARRADEWDDRLAEIIGAEGKAKGKGTETGMG